MSARVAHPADGPGSWTAAACPAWLMGTAVGGRDTTIHCPRRHKSRHGPVAQNYHGALTAVSPLATIPYRFDLGRGSIV